MQKTLTLKLLPSEAADPGSIKQYIAASEGRPEKEISGYIVVKRSIDARGRQAFVNLSVKVFIDEPVEERKIPQFDFRKVSPSSKSALIIGAGPAGLFAALKLLEHGIRPVILERGKDVRARRRDLAVLNKSGAVNPESNYCFGEGGAGTYSDGKLYTRSNKRGDINRILNLFVHFGAEESILFDAHPHIGTNKLPQIITSMRKTILEHGGVFLFEKKVTDLVIAGNHITEVRTADGDNFTASVVILATGHSARDIFTLLHHKKILIESKPFALGVRVEHPQALIDSAQYHCASRGPFLPPAAYSWVQQVANRGVFSFCMCPGGIIAPASTAAGEIVVNGWSPSKRNNPFANSGIVVAVEDSDMAAWEKHGALKAMAFQQSVEQKAFRAGGGDLVAPAQRLTDFTAGKLSQSLPSCSYLPGIAPALLNKVLPDFIYTRLREAFIEYGKKMRGYLSDEAVVVATESRTSSPVRIPRDKITLQHPQMINLYPCGEGAGYAGGIVSAAMDGERVADAVVLTLHNNTG